MRFLTFSFICTTQRDRDGVRCTMYMCKLKSVLYQFQFHHKGIHATIISAEYIVESRSRTLMHGNDECYERQKLAHTGTYTEPMELGREDSAYNNNILKWKTSTHIESIRHRGTRRGRRICVLWMSYVCPGISYGEERTNKNVYFRFSYSKSLACGMPCGEGLYPAVYIDMREIDEFKRANIIIIFDCGDNIDRTIRVYDSCRCHADAAIKIDSHTNKHDRNEMESSTTAQILYIHDCTRKSHILNDDIFSISASSVCDRCHW